MELLFLGTGAGLPAKRRNVTSIALLLLEERGTTWLFDCGEGTQHQILKTNIRPAKIEKIFISHLHGDHLFGLPGLLGSRSFQAGIEKVTIYGPKGIRDFVEVVLRVSEMHAKYEIEIIEYTEGQIFEDNQFTVEAYLLEHVIPSYGFRIVQKNLPGALDMEKLTAYTIPNGPIRGELKAGRTVTLANGTVLDGKDYIKEPVKGKIIAIAGDTKKCSNAIQLAKDADWLVHEATFRKGQEERAETYGHSTNVEVAAIAREARVKNLIMTHISARFTEEDMPVFLAEAEAIFPNCIIAEDFLSIKIK